MARTHLNRKNPHQLICETYSILAHAIACVQLRKSKQIFVSISLSLLWIIFGEENFDERCSTIATFETVSNASFAITDYRMSTEWRSSKPVDSPVRKKTIVFVETRHVSTNQNNNNITLNVCLHWWTESSQQMMTRIDQKNSLDKLERWLPLHVWWLRCN